MMKMILADDEPVISKGIQKLLDWKSLGIEIIGEYEDGNSALEGIVKLHPDLALLDIAMPGKTGVEILKECNSLQIPTKIIFISGFQDFEYAKAAVTYGAVDYLLKPVIRDELVNAVEKCIRKTTDTEPVEKEKTENDYSKLIEVEETNYTTVLTELIYQENMNEQMKRLIHFSFISFLEEYLDQRKIGITFTKKDHVAVVLKGLSRQECLEVTEELWRQSVIATGQKTAFILGREVTKMSEIPVVFGECMDMAGYCFFADQIEPPVFEVGKEVFRQEHEQEHYAKVREEMLAAILAQDKETFEKKYEWFAKIVCRLSEGKKEDTCYYFYTTVKMVDEKCQDMGICDEAIEMKDFLEKGRQTSCYGELVTLYESYFMSYFGAMQSMAVSSEKQNYMKAKNYIENHYQENLTLQILADEIHMNPYYFSAFFKKNAGVNFKDYVSKIRIEHAVSLLISTNKKTYEIAMDVGFTDARSFSDTFQRYYHETPNAYRKRIVQ